MEFIVDIGATYKVLPAEMLEEPGVKVVRMAGLLADNRVLERPLRNRIEIEKLKASVTPVVFGEENICLLESVMWSSWA